MQNNFKIIIIQLLVSSMLTLKDLPIFALTRKNKTHQPYPLLQSTQHYQIKGYRLSEQNKKPLSALDQGGRLSHKAILDQPRTNTKLNRRISTAGTSKRFPKDFFKMQNNIQSDETSPKFAFRSKKKQSQTAFKQRQQQQKIQLSNYCLLQPEERQNQKTPKFHQPSPDTQKDSINEFLAVENQLKVVTPFLSMDALQNRQQQQRMLPHKPVNFLKKVKKGECLRKRDDCNKTQGHNMALPQLNKLRSCYH